MKISIIIPTLNEVAGIVQAIHRAQACNPHEIIVVDGGSNDGTVDLVRKCDCHLLRTERGRALQQNAGARHATGQALLFLHADSWLASDGLAQVEKALSQSSTRVGVFRHRIEADGCLYRLLESGNAMRVRWLKMAYGDQGIFITREFLEQVGGFPDVPLLEDVLLMRQARRSSRVALLPGPLFISARRWQKHGVIRQTARNWALLTAERLGVSPRRLAAYYEPHHVQAQEETAASQ